MTALHFTFLFVVGEQVLHLAIVIIQQTGRLWFDREKHSAIYMKHICESEFDLIKRLIPIHGKNTIMILNYFSPRFGIRTESKLIFQFRNGTAKYFLNSTYKISII